MLLDDLMALAVFACSGTLQERLHMAFWTLNRQGSAGLLSSCAIHVGEGL